MAIGFLFMGSGSLTFGTTPEAGNWLHQVHAHANAATYPPPHVQLLRW